MVERRAPPHIGNQSSDCAVLFADGNSSSAVVLVLRMLWIETALQHRAPRAVFWCVGHPVFCGPFALQAATRPRLASTKVFSIDISASATVANATPLSAPPFVGSRVTENRPPAKPFSRDVNKSGASIGRGRDAPPWR